MLRAHAFDGTEWQPIDDPEQISDELEADRFIWATATASSLGAGGLGLVATELGLDPHAIEDALGGRQRPKFEPYPKHLFIVAHQLDAHDGTVTASQIACFIGERFVLVIHEGAQRTIDGAERTLFAATTMDAGGALHAVLDPIVDEYEDVANRLEASMTAIEEQPLGERFGEVERTLYDVTRRIAKLRRYVEPAERTMQGILEHEWLPGAHLVRLRDVHDHLLRIIDQLRTISDLANATTELLSSIRSNALNEVTKRLTGWAAVIAVPTLVSGIYGMNFALVPHGGRLFGFWFALGIMAVSAGVLYTVLRRKNWI